MVDLSHWSEVANVLYIPALAVMYGGWIIRFFQKWYAVMKWPDMLLLCFGIGVFTVMAIPKFAPYFAPKTVVIREQAQPLPINSMEVTALKTENAQLRTENAKLKRIKQQQPRPTVIMASPVPSACPSLPVVISSGSAQKIPTQDCSDLLGAQALYDRAAEAESAAKGTTAYNNALSTMNEATDNLNRMAARLCYGYIGPR